MSEPLPPPGVSAPPPPGSSQLPAPPQWVGQALRRAAAIEEPLKRRLYLVAALTHRLEPRGIRPVVVGGTLLAAHHEEVDWEYLRSRAGAEGLGKALERVARGRYRLRRHPPRAGR